MGSMSNGEILPRVEIGPAAEFVCTDADVEQLGGGLVRLLFFCEQRPVGSRDGEMVLKARLVTTPELLPVIIRKIEYALERCRRCGF
jgi:hypothetical protein